MGKMLVSATTRTVSAYRAGSRSAFQVLSSDGDGTLAIPLPFKVPVSVWPRNSPMMLAGGLTVERIGAKLHAVRRKWGLTLREVEDRSVRLAEEWGNPSYRISASWLARVERDDRDLSAAKLIVLAAIFSIPAEQLLALCPAGNGSPLPYDQAS